MSKLKVDQISKATGTVDTFTLPASDGTVGQLMKTDGSGNLGFVSSAVGGKVLQVLQSVKTDTASTTVYGGTWADIAGTDQAAAGAIWCVKITPSAATSKILCMFTVSYAAGGATNRRINWKLLRDSTAPVLGDAASSRIPVTMSGNTISSEGMLTGGYTYLDSPSSTSELTYKVQWDIHSTGNTLYLNRSYDDTDNNQYSRATSQITVMEIGA